MYTYVCMYSDINDDDDDFDNAKIHKISNKFNDVLYIGVYVWFNSMKIVIKYNVTK